MNKNEINDIRKHMLSLQAEAHANNGKVLFVLVKETPTIHEVHDVSYDLNDILNSLQELTGEYKIYAKAFYGGE